MILTTSGPGAWVANQAEAITVSTTAVGLTPPAAANTALIQVLTNDVRFWTDGSTPTASAGWRAGDGDWIVLNTRTEIVNFLAIREDSADASINVQYG